MTACTNTKEVSKGKAVVSATLAGALAVGMVPGVALAAQPTDDEGQNDNIELMDALSEKGAFEAGKVTSLTVGGRAVDMSAITITNAQTGDWKILQIAPSEGATYNTGSLNGTYLDGSGDKTTTATSTQCLKVTFQQRTKAKYGDEASAADIAQADLKAGNYWLTVTVNGDGADVPKTITNATCHTPITIVGDSLDGATAYEIDADDRSNVSDTDFEYDGNTQIGTLTSASGTYGQTGYTPASYGNFGISLNGVALEPDRDYTVTRFVRLSDNATIAADDVVDAGSYAAVVQGKQGGRFDGSSATVKFEVSALDLSKAVVVVNDITSGDYADDADGLKYSYGAGGAVVDTTTAGFTVDEDTSKEKALANDFEIATINGKPISDFAPAVKFNVSVNNDTHGPVKVYDADNTTLLGWKYVQGEYQMTVTADASVNAGGKTNVTNSGSAKASVVANLNAVKWNMNNVHLTEGAGNTWTGSMLGSDTVPGYFNPAGAVAWAELGGDKTYTSGTDTLLTLNDPQVTDRNGNTATVADLSTPGDWIVVLSVKTDAKGNEFSYGGKATVKVHVSAGKVDAKTEVVVLSQKGNVTDHPTYTYDGTDTMQKINITVKCGDVVLTQGADYTLEARDSLTGKIVTEAVNSGDYNIVVKSDKYDIEEGTTGFTLTVNPVTVKQLAIGDLSEDPAWTDGLNSAVEFTGVLPWTGEAIVPSVIKYKDADGNTGTLPADAYSIVRYWYADKYDSTRDWSGETVKEMKDAGYYKVAIAATNTEVGRNFNLVNCDTTEVVRVKKAGVLYADVTNDAWYYNSVNDAAALGYVKGIGESGLYKPNAAITRADVCVILYRMAGVDSANQSQENPNVSYTTTFTDVDGNAYYARAVAWAQNMGVVNGRSATKFAPGDNITREEFACMISNFAKWKGDYKLTDKNAALNAISDASNVSSWASESVAYTVENKLMGKNGVFNPKSSITRAEVAAVAVDYQPHGILGDK